MFQAADLMLPNEFCGVPSCQAYLFISCDSWIPCVTLCGSQHVHFGMPSLLGACLSAIIDMSGEAYI